jgi:hypothetical protein
VSERTCSVEGCNRPHRARGMCSTCYNQTRYTTDQRHAKVPVPCAWCDKPSAKEQGRAKRYAHLFCSYDCRDAWRSMLAGTNICHLTKWHPAHPDYVKPWRTRPNPATMPPRRWTAGWCAHCDATFVDRQPDARFCSPLCTRRYWRKRWKEQSGVPDAVRQYVYDRDRWRCQLCRRAIPRDVVVPHLMAATVDHVVPQSQGGSHDAANLRAAHFICNSRRGDRGGAEQLALIG